MTRIHALLLALALLAFAGCSGTPLRDDAAARAPVILVSIDGFRADYLQRGMTPTLAALAADGVRAEAMQPSFPSITFPNHYTLVTGLYPDHHGIVHNTIQDPALGRFTLGNRAAVGDGRWWNEGEPIWVTAQKQGLHTATMFWPGSEAAIHGVRPDHWRPFDGDVAPQARVDQVLAWLDLPAARRPAFITLYFDAVDGAGHWHGPDSPEVSTALRDTDTMLARLVDGLRRRGLYDRTNLVIVSDHGMTATPPSQVVYLDDIVDMRDVDVVTYEVPAELAPKPARAAEVERALLAPHAHMQCRDKAALPARLHYGGNPRVPAIVCIPDDGWLVSTHARQAAHKRVLRGEHGYDNADPHMRALFVAHGPAFKRGVVVAEFPNVDVYPLLAHLLGIRPQPNDGDLAPLRGALAPEAITARR
ncbi:MAG: ectonucleotide pyrophosphatase/phosphodiesterase [Mizugakiibacter sp.]|uniref:alkaline phosphatase family protein n=1 Tax=Mizugakiibacter sp. TaxID=1972610 RepID=UPI0031BEF13E|nr:ectonucleotide pyrophosphatase/phosphodiesterase [Xanthomonadaceae bacterium]